MLATRRWGIQIVRDIPIMGGAGKTRILYGANVNSSQLYRHLDHLVDKGFFDLSAKEPSTYEVTPKGNALLEKIDELIDPFEMEAEAPND